MKHLFVWIIFCVLPLSAANRALLVAVEQNMYIPDSELFGLDIDLEKMIQVCRMLGFKDDEIKILRGSTPTARAIETAIESWLIHGVSEGEKAFFYYTGHGSFEPDTAGEEDDKFDEILCPSDLKIANNRFINSFSDDRFGSLISRLRTENCLIIIDACHSGTITRGGPTKTYRMKRLQSPAQNNRRSANNTLTKNTTLNHFAPKTTNPDNYVSISACQDHQSAIATQKGSLFTLGVFHAIDQAYKSNRPITPNLIATFSGRFISKYAPDKSKIHHPKLGGDAYRFGEPVFSSRVASPQNDLHQPSSPQDNQPSTSSSTRPNWNLFYKWAQKCAFALDVRANQEKHRLGEKLVVDIQDIPDDGYLYVFAVDPNDSISLLFPNKYQTNNRIQLKRNTRSYAVESLANVSIPDKNSPFILRAVEPLGDSLVVVFHFDSPLNFGEKGAIPTGDSVFKILEKADLAKVETKMRGYAVESKPTTTNFGPFGAGLMVLKTIP